LESSIESFINKNIIIEYMKTEILEDMGLTTAEAKIYLALLKSGSTKSGKIIDSTKLQSSTVYHVLGSLLEKGLVSYVLQGKIKYFQATSPENFLSFLDEKKRKFLEILPQLKEMEDLSKQKQTAKVYEGFNGVQTAFNDILTTMSKDEEYYFFQIMKKKLLDDRIIMFFKNYHIKRAEKGIKVKGLTLRKSKNLVNNIFKGIKNTKIRYLDEFTPSGIVIYNNKVITVDWSNIPTAIVIESESISNSYKKFFLEKWKKAKQ
jgi:HTH-type transcriptional regulator, sugar sensing transcriptional regulator